MEKQSFFIGQSRKPILVSIGLGRTNENGKQNVYFGYKYKGSYKLYQEQLTVDMVKQFSSHPTMEIILLDELVLVEFGLFKKEESSTGFYQFCDVVLVKTYILHGKQYAVIRASVLRKMQVLHTRVSTTALDMLQWLGTISKEYVKQSFVVCSRDSMERETPTKHEKMKERVVAIHIDVTRIFLGYMGELRPKHLYPTTHRPVHGIVHAWDDVLGSSNAGHEAFLSFKKCLTRIEKELKNGTDIVWIAVTAPDTIGVNHQNIVDSLVSLFAPDDLKRVWFFFCGLEMALDANMVEQGVLVFPKYISAWEVVHAFIDGVAPVQFGPGPSAILQFWKQGYERRANSDLLYTSNRNRLVYAKEFSGLITFHTVRGSPLNMVNFASQGLLRQYVEIYGTKVVNIQKGTRVVSQNSGSMVQFPLSHQLKSTLVGAISSDLNLFQKQLNENDERRVVRRRSPPHVPNYQPSQQTLETMHRFITDSVARLAKAVSSEIEKKEKGSHKPAPCSLTSRVAKKRTITELDKLKEENTRLMRKVRFLERSGYQSSPAIAQSTSKDQSTISKAETKLLETQYYDLTNRLDQIVKEDREQLETKERELLSASKEIEKLQTSFSDLYKQVQDVTKENGHLKEIITKNQTTYNTLVNNYNILLQNYLAIRRVGND